MFKHLFGGDKNKTFKPLKGHKSGTKQAMLHDRAKATLGAGDMRLAVKLPEGEDENEWIATHTVDFYNTVSLLYGTVAEYCTSETCPAMTAGPKYEYLWASPSQPKPIKCSAPEYVDLLMSHIESVISDESIFPTSADKPFPKSFRGEVKTIFKRLFRVFAHIYYSHFDKVSELGAEAHLNTSYKHFIYFALEFGLIDRKELDPLEELTNALTNGILTEGGGGGGAGSTDSGRSQDAASAAASASGGAGSARLV